MDCGCNCPSPNVCDKSNEEFDFNERFNQIDRKYKKEISEASENLYNHLLSLLYDGKKYFLIKDYYGYILIKTDNIKIDSVLKIIFNGLVKRLEGTVTIGFRYQLDLSSFNRQKLIASINKEDFDIKIESKNDLENIIKKFDERNLKMDDGISKILQEVEESHDSHRDMLSSLYEDSGMRDFKRNLETINKFIDKLTALQVKEKYIKCNISSEEEHKKTLYGKVNDFKIELSNKPDVCCSLSLSDYIFVKKQYSSLDETERCCSVFYNFETETSYHIFDDKGIKIISEEEFKEVKDKVELFKK